MADSLGAHVARRKRTRAMTRDLVEVHAGIGVAYAGQMVDSSELVRDGKFADLRQRLQDDGYLLLRQFLKASEVYAARAFVCESIEEYLDPRHSLTDAVASTATPYVPPASNELPVRTVGKRKSPGSDRKLAAESDTDERRTKTQHEDVNPKLLDRQDLAHDHRLLSLFQHPKMWALFAELFEVPEDQVATTWYKWLRAVPTNGFTGLHFDRVYMGQGSPRLLTLWLPLGDTPSVLGSLLVAPGSHSSSQFASLRASYGSRPAGKDGTVSGWCADDPGTLEALCGPINWVTADFKAGDICILGLDVLHMSSTNTSSPTRYRISCDTRWQPAADPVDKRVGKVVSHGEWLQQLQVHDSDDL